MKQYYVHKLRSTTFLLFIMCFTVTAFAQRSGGGCTDPVISETSGPGTICEGESASLTATHNGEGVNW